MENINNINVETAVELIKTNKDLKLLDIRGPYEVKATGFIEGSMLLDPNDRQIIETIENLDKNKEYLLYCASGGRSSAVSQYMLKKGFKNLYNLVNAGYIELSIALENSK